MTSYSNVTGASHQSYSFNQGGPKSILKNGANKTTSVSTSVDPELLEVQIRADPNTMDGYHDLWGIAVQA